MKEATKICVFLYVIVIRSGSLLPKTPKNSKKNKNKAVMLTRKKRIGIGKKIPLPNKHRHIYILYMNVEQMLISISDSSPKTSVSKNMHLLTTETIQNTVNMLSTPTRRNRFMLGNNHNNDDSPVLSQEPINISWKWNNEGTPIRPTNKSSKLRRSITNSSPQLQHLQRLTAKRNSSENQNGTAAQSPKLMAEPETHSPKGLYKFQEEMRKIQFDNESDTSCDTFNNKSMTGDTGYPTSAGGTAPAEMITDYRLNDSLDVPMETNGEIKQPSQNGGHGIDDDLAVDMFDDSDFDQILLTCQIPAEKKNTGTDNNQTTATNQTSVKKASSAPEIKTSCNNSSSSGSNWNLDDDCFDDLVKDFDVDIPSDSLNTSAKFTRHKSMPQQPQTPSTSNTKVFKVQQSTHLQNMHVNRKSFTRHESMPITNRALASNNNMSKQQNSSM